MFGSGTGFQPVGHGMNMGKMPMPPLEIPCFNRL